MESEIHAARNLRSPHLVGNWPRTWVKLNLMRKRTPCRKRDRVGLSGNGNKGEAVGQDQVKTGEPTQSQKPERWSEAERRPGRAERSGRPAFTQMARLRVISVLPVSVLLILNPVETMVRAKLPSG